MPPVFAEEYAKTARIIHINIYFVGNLKENDYFCALNPMQNELYIRKERIMKRDGISEEDALARLRAAPFQTVQYSFHTERAVAYLNRLEVVNV